MGLLFQCLTEEDVQSLTADQLTKLKAIFYHALYTNPDIKEKLCEEAEQALNIVRGEQGR